MVRIVASIIVIGAFLRFLMWMRERSGSESTGPLMPFPSPEESDGMYCPKCGVQFRPGFSRCEECDVALVREKPEMEPENITERVYTDLIEVYLPSDMNEVVFIKSLLQEADIPYSIPGEDQNGLPFPSRAGELRVLVPKEYEQKARTLLNNVITENKNNQEDV